MRISLLIVLFCYGTSCLGQVNIFNQSLTDTSLNIVYAGVDNEMIIRNGPPQHLLSFTAIHGILIKVATNKYILRPNMADSCIIYLYKNNKQIFRKGFAIQSLPQPVAKLGTIETTLTTVKEILANPTVSIVLPGCYYKHPFIPSSYRFRIENEAKEYKYSKTNYGLQLSSEQKELLKKCSAGTTIIIDDTHYKSKDGSTEGALSQFIIIE